MMRSLIPFALFFRLSAIDVPLPNVIVILADDLGYGDVHANNPSSKIPTPNIDRLAEEGMRFTDAHTPSAVCTPTRYGLLTGRYCWRSRLKRGVLNGRSPALIEDDRRTIANVFSDAGYHTACIGKWHLGMNMPTTGNGKRKDLDWAGTIAKSPTSNGFDHFFGVSASLDMPPYTWIEDQHFVEPATDQFKARGFPAYMRGGPIAPGFDPQAGLDTIAGHASDWIKKQATSRRPFFLYLPLTAPHKPVLPAERFIGKSKLGPYGDFILAVDDAVGNILKTLDDRKITDQTLLVLTSDNGSFMYRIGDPSSPIKLNTNGKGHVQTPSVQGFLPQNHQANGNFRGTKADIWEAGHRVPFLVRWPGKTPANSTCDTPVCLTDLLATSADLLNQNLPYDCAEDSHSILPLMQAVDSPPARPAIIHHSINGTFAIRRGHWKLILGSGSGGRGVPGSKAFDGKVQLYDMAKDPSETTNLAVSQPEVVKELTAQLDKFRSNGRSR